MGSMSSSSSLAATIGVQIRPPAWRDMNVICSGVTSWAATHRSPSFSRSSSSTMMMNRPSSRSARASGIVARVIRRPPRGPSRRSGVPRVGPRHQAPRSPAYLERTDGHGADRDHAAWSAGMAGSRSTGASLPRSVPGADLLEAVLAVDRPALGGQERHLRGLAADRTGHVVHGAGPGHAAALPPQRPALGAPAGLVHEALGLVELLLAGREGELDAAVAARQRLVDEGSHRSLLGTFGVTRTGALLSTRGPPGQRESINDWTP